MLTNKTKKENIYDERESERETQMRILYDSMMRKIRMLKNAEFCCGIFYGRV